MMLRVVNSRSTHAVYVELELGVKDILFEIESPLSNPLRHLRSFGTSGALVPQIVVPALVSPVAVCCDTADTVYLWPRYR